LHPSSTWKAFIATDATTYPQCDIKLAMNVLQGAERGDEQGSIGLARELFAGPAPHVTGGGCVSFVLDDETDRVAGP
jgi:hypothetical protein